LVAVPAIKGEPGGSPQVVTEPKKEPYVGLIERHRARMHDPSAFRPADLDHARLFSTGTLLWAVGEPGVPGLGNKLGILADDGSRMDQTPREAAQRANALGRELPFYVHARPFDVRLPNGTEATVIGFEGERLLGDIGGALPMVVEEALPAEFNAFKSEKDKNNRNKLDSLRVRLRDIGFTLKRDKSQKPAGSTQARPAPILGAVSGADLSSFMIDGVINVLAADQDNSLVNMVRARRKSLGKDTSDVEDMKREGLDAVVHIASRLERPVTAMLVHQASFKRVKKVLKPKGIAVFARLEFSYGFDSSNPQQSSVEPKWIGSPKVDPLTLVLPEHIDEAVKNMKAAGADGVKVLIYMNKDDRKHWNKQLQFAENASRACAKYPKIPILVEALTPKDEHSASAKEIKAAQGRPNLLQVKRKWADWQAENAIEAVMDYARFADVVKAEMPGDFELISKDPARSMEIIDTLIDLQIDDSVFAKGPEAVLSFVKQALQKKYLEPDEMARALDLVRNIMRLDEAVGDRWLVILSAGKDFPLFKREMALVKNFARKINGSTGERRFAGSFGGRANWKNYFDPKFAGKEDTFLSDRTQNGLAGRLRVIDKILRHGVFTRDHNEVTADSYSGSQNLFIRNKVDPVIEEGVFRFFGMVVLPMAVFNAMDPHGMVETALTAVLTVTAGTVFSIVGNALLHVIGDKSQFFNRFPQRIKRAAFYTGDYAAFLVIYFLLIYGYVALGAYFLVPAEFQKWALPAGLILSGLSSVSFTVEEHRERNEKAEANGVLPDSVMPMETLDLTHWKQVSPSFFKASTWKDAPRGNPSTRLVKDQEVPQYSLADLTDADHVVNGNPNSVATRTLKAQLGQMSRLIHRSAGRDNEVSVVLTVPSGLSHQRVFNAVRDLFRTYDVLLDVNLSQFLAAVIIDRREKADPLAAAHKYAAQLGPRKLHALPIDSGGYRINWELDLKADPSLFQNVVVEIIDLLAGQSVIVGNNLEQKLRSAHTSDKDA